MFLRASLFFFNYHGHFLHACLSSSMGWEEMRSWPPVRQGAGFISIRWRRGQRTNLSYHFSFLFRSRSERRPGIEWSSIMILALAVNEDRATTNHEFSWAKIGIQSSRLFDWYHHIVHVGAGVVKHLCRRNDPSPTNLARWP